MGNSTSRANKNVRVSPPTRVVMPEIEEERREQARIKNEQLQRIMGMLSSTTTLMRKVVGDAITRGDEVEATEAMTDDLVTQSYEFRYKTAKCRTRVCMDAQRVCAQCVAEPCWWKSCFYPCVNVSPEHDA